MNIKIIRIVFIILLLLGGLAIANAFYPEIGRKIISLLPSSARNQATQLSEQSSQTISNVLGEDAGLEDKKFSQTEIEQQLKDLSAKISSQEFIKETTETINKIVTQKVEETKQMPAQLYEQAQTEAKKQVCEQVCGEWIEK